MPAAGRGERFGDDKLFAEIEGTPLLGWTLRAIAKADIFRPVVVVAPADRWDRIRELATTAGIGHLELVEGGASRQESVRAGLAACAGASTVCVHDAARPLCPPRLFAAVVAGAASTGAATAAIPCVDSIKRIDGRHVAETLDRSQLVSIQTPQAFLAGILDQAHERAAAEGVAADDDCALVERGGGRVLIVEGDPRNIKVTRPVDLVLVRALVAEETAAT